MRSYLEIDPVVILAHYMKVRGTSKTSDGSWEAGDLAETWITSEQMKFTEPTNFHAFCTLRKLNYREETTALG